MTNFPNNFSNSQYERQKNVCKKQVLSLSGIGDCSKYISNLKQCESIKG